MKQKSPAELRDIKQRIEALFPDTDPELLKDEINLVFDTCNTRSLISRDTHPTKHQMVSAIEEINRHLEAIMHRFCEDDGGAVMGWLSAVMDDPDKKGIESGMVSFADKLRELHQTTQRALDEFYTGDGEIELSGRPHTRKSRTHVRDTVMIPMLAVTACVNGLSPADDWEDLDKACEFAKLVMEYASIPAPGTGKNVATRGETAQGRLRRMVKEAARRYQETGQV